MFRQHDKVVYPGHGVACIKDIVKKIVGGQITEFYELSFLHKEMTILVPISNSDIIGLRPLSSMETIDTLFEKLGRPSVRTNPHELLVVNTWNKRNKEYQLKLRTGNLEALSQIYRELKSLSHQKELSFGEKNMLTQTEMLLAEEIAIVKQLDAERAVKDLRALFADSSRSIKQHKFC